MRVIVPMCVVLSVSGAASAQGIVDLGVLPGAADSSATDVSADGTVVVGRSGDRVFRWTAGQGIQDLGINVDSVTAISGDGRFVVGSYTNSSGASRAFRWSAAAGLQDLGTLPEPDDALNYSAAKGVNFDGSVIVGFCHGYTGFRWTATSGMQDIRAPSGDRFWRPHGVSSDGSVVVGDGSWDSGGYGPCRWSSSGGYRPLSVDPSAPGHGITARATNTSGSIVVGILGGDSGQWRAFRWTAAGGVIYLPVPPGAESSEANDVSDNGTLVGVAGGAAVVWQPTGSVATLRDRLSSLGASLAGWTSLTGADGVSRDGRYVVGHGVRSGQIRAFLADLGPGCASADLNGSGRVDGVDLRALLDAWGAASGSGDLDRDGMVSAKDLGLLLLHWGPCG